MPVARYRSRRSLTTLLPMAVVYLVIGVVVSGVSAVLVAGMVVLALVFAEEARSDHLAVGPETVTIGRFLRPAVTVPRGDVDARITAGGGSNDSFRLTLDLPDGKKVKRLTAKGERQALLNEALGVIATGRVPAGRTGIVWV